MNKNIAAIIAALLIFCFASCARSENDNPVYQAQPADTIEYLS